MKGNKPVTKYEKCVLKSIDKFDPDIIDRYFPEPTPPTYKDVRRRLIEKGLIAPNAGYVVVRYDVLTAAGRDALEEVE